MVTKVIMTFPLTSEISDFNTNKYLKCNEDLSSTCKFKYLYSAVSKIQASSNQNDKPGLFNTLYHAFLKSFLNQNIYIWKVWYSFFVFSLKNNCRQFFQISDIFKWLFKTFVWYFKRVKNNSKILKRIKH